MLTHTCNRPVGLKSPWRGGFLIVVATATVAPVQARSVLVDVAPIDVSYRASERFESGALADEEKGRLQGLCLRAGVVTGANTLALRISQIDGLLEYRGSTQIGLPITTTTVLSLQDTALEYAHEIRTSGPWRGSAGIGAGVRQIDRDIQPTFFSGPLTENMTWQYARAGVQVGYQFNSRLELTAQARGERGLRASLNVDYHGYGDPATLHPRPANGYELETAAVWRYTPRVAFSLSYALHDQQYGSTPYSAFLRNGIVAGQVRYPGSQQTMRIWGIHAVFNLP